MKVSWKYVLGVTTIAGVLGVATYAIILHKREQKAKENEISLDEAESIVEEGIYKGSVVKRDKKIDIPLDKTVPHINLNSEELAKEITSEVLEEYNLLSSKKKFENALVGKIRDDVERKHKIKAKSRELVEKENEEEDLKLMEEDLREEELEQEPILLVDEGEGKLRYDPNSDEALLQFMRMELADWAPHEKDYKLLEELFDYIFEPETEGDVVLHSKLVDYRSEFFGPASRWSPRVSFTDIMLYFARKADYDMGRGVRYWINHFVNGVNIELNNSLDYMVDLMNSHDFYFQDTNGNQHYGLFGLDGEGIRRATDVAASTSDGMLSYEIEFNIFLDRKIRGDQ